MHRQIDTITYNCDNCGPHLNASTAKLCNNADNVYCILYIGAVTSRTRARARAETFHEQDTTDTRVGESFHFSFSFSISRFQ